ncbi:actin interacting protein 3-domain-containing protein [Flagelloscypha sp. PMI_526]|nr:actin interacting protein 3-domain-containing protein [Flagelloscypha sp. PMI_526]
MSRNLPSTPSPGTSRQASNPSMPGSTRSRDHPAVESALLESLTQWSQLKIDEGAVSDVYVRLGNDFNAAVQAFASFSIDMGELATAPDDLRVVLEQCLAEDATPENLEIYLPTVWGIITNLRQGLRGKQSVYGRIVSDNRRSDSVHERTGSRSSKSSMPGSVSGSRASHRSQRSIAESESGRDSLRRSVHASSISSRRKDPSSPSLLHPPLASANGDDNGFVGGFSPGLQDPRRQSSDDPPPMMSLPRAPRPLDNDMTPQPSSPPQQALAAPPSMKRYSLVDAPAPISSPNLVIEPSSPDPPVTPPPTTPGIESTPAIANSLAALKKSETLERRASKRFSTYNISKMTGMPRERSQRQSNRRSLAVSSALTPTELATLTEADDECPVAAPPAPQVNGTSSPRPVTPPTEAPHIPRLPATPEPPRLPPHVAPEPTYTKPSSIAVAEPTVEAASSMLTIFLQLGREVKKAIIEPGMSFASLRVLFVDKFSYSPGKENFPAIYIHDPASGVQYELEDIDEITDKCLLSLNIDPLDQIKQHIDFQISILTSEFKEMRTTIANQPVMMAPAPFHAVGPPLAESTPAPVRPSDKQFATVARRLSRFQMPSRSDTSSPPPALPLMPQLTGSTLVPQMTGGSVVSEYSNRVVNDLKTQFDEVQNLRRDLGIMRQLYSEFMKQTKDSLGTLRAQTKSVKQLASAGVGGSRGIIESGKAKLDERSQNVLTEIEKLQDSVEGVKDDVIKRHATPKVFFFKGVKKDIEKAAKELESLQEQISTVKPMWKKTWEEELQNIVEEQQFLTHQEEFLADLVEDHKALAEVYGHIEQVISIRGTAVAPRGRGFKPPPQDEGHEGLPTVLMELRGAQMDPEKRLKAIEANQRIRAKELASHSDELQAELSDFVSGKKLKMTGGAEEAERVRQKRNEQTLRAMFNGGNAPISDMNAEPPSPEGLMPLGGFSTM